jgi:hypothetical protein
MNHQASRTLQQTRTPLSPAEVLAAAKQFFARRNSIYSAYLEKEGPSYVDLRGMGGEEIIIGVSPTEGGTLVNGSTYLFDQQVARFLATLPQLPSSAAQAESAPSASGVAEVAGGAA